MRRTGDIKRWSDWKIRREAGGTSVGDIACAEGSEQDGPDLLHDLLGGREAGEAEADGVKVAEVGLHGDDRVGKLPHVVTEVGLGASLGDLLVDPEDGADRAARAGENAGRDEVADELDRLPGREES